MEQEGSFYLIWREYLGPNREDHLNDNFYFITTKPARYNMSHQICLDGWAGTTNDWSVTALGEYSTIEAARECILENDEYATEIPETDEFYPHDMIDDYEILEVYRETPYIRLDPESTYNWIFPGTEINPDATDEELETLAETLEKEAQSEAGYTLTDLLEILKTYRDELLEDEE